MAIFNQISPETQEENKTVDAETGAVLFIEYGVFGDDYVEPEEGTEYFFMFSLPPVNITFNSIKTLKCKEEERVIEVNHFIHSIQLHGKPQQLQYFDLLINMLKVHGDEFGFTARTTDYKEKTLVSFPDAERERVLNWQKKTGRHD